MHDEFVDAGFAPFEGGKVFYQATSEAERTAILIHGGGPGAFGYSNYRRNIAALALNRRIVVIDLPGFGQSDPTKNPESHYGPFSRAVFAVMDHLGLSKVSLVGNSLGGATSIRCALDKPERIDRLALMGPGGVPPLLSPHPSVGLKKVLAFYDGAGPTKEKLREILEHLVFDPSAVGDDVLDERLAAATKPEYLANPPMRLSQKLAVDQLWREPLGELRHPTLILWGREDRITPLDAALFPLKMIPNAQLHVFPNCGHWVQWEKADEFNRLVDDFLC